MKSTIIYMFMLLNCWQLLGADWIQPPLTTSSGYPVPHPDFEPQFPHDHGSHPGYAIEWWYWVGHLRSLDGSREFGFQSTVFRLEGAADHIAAPASSDPFGTQQLFMANLSLSDLSAGRYLHAERILREGWQAQVSTQTLDLQVGPITARWDATHALIEKELQLPQGRTLRITLRPLKPPVIFGERGLSRKGKAPAAVSWYWTYSRLAISGVLIEDGKCTELSGIGWMDHEIASNQLSRNLVGWDWTAIQLDNGTELKAYRLRTQEGEADPWSALYWIDAQGEQTHVYAQAFEWQTAKTWKSAHTDNDYPTEVTLRAVHPKTGVEMIYHVRPMMAAQEFVGNRPENAYWEGACAVFDRNNTRIGQAYLELVGYGNAITSHLNR